MKKTLLILAILQLCAQAFAGNPVTETIEVTISLPPEVKAFLPADGTVIAQEGILRITVTASDLNRGDTLEYRYLINNAHKGKWQEIEGWTTAASVEFRPTAGYVGLNTLKAEVRDGTYTIATGTAEVFVFRKLPANPR